MSRTISLVYLAFLTLLLVVRNPLDWFGQQELIVTAFQLVGFVVHFVTFVILALLMLLAQWPLKNTVLIGLLAVYAAFTELIQGPIPNRSPQWGDFFQDLGGLAVGTIFWLIATRWLFTAPGVRAVNTAAGVSDPGINGSEVTVST